MEFVLQASRSLWAKGAVDNSSALAQLMAPFLVYGPLWNREGEERSRSEEPRGTCEDGS